MKIITLTLNPAFDVHADGEFFTPFSENLFKLKSRDAGGKGINVSRALNVDEIKNLALLLLGEDNGKEFLTKLDEEKITHKEFFIKGAIRENITLHSDNKETRISFEGFSATDGDFNKLKELTEKEEGSVIVFSGRLPSGISKDKVIDFLCSLKEKGCKIVLDSKSLAKEDLLKIKPFLIKPNEEEILKYSDIDSLEINSLIKGAKSLKEQGIENVLVTLGEKGAVLISDEGVFLCSVPEITAVSTIGAGDSTIAGFISGIKRGLSVEETLKRALAFGTAACLTEGTKAPKKSDIESIINEIKIEKVRD